jgi:hypothetical protein
VGVLITGPGGALLGALLGAAVATGTHGVYLVRSDRADDDTYPPAAPAAFLDMLVVSDAAAAWLDGFRNILSPR